MVKIGTRFEDSGNLYEVAEPGTGNNGDWFCKLVNEDTGLWLFSEIDILNKVKKEQNPISLDQAIELVEEELKFAVTKFPTWPTDPNHASSIVMEEAGELDQAVMETIYEAPKSTIEDVKKEAVQTAAMAIRFLLSLDKYEFEKSAQHIQEGVFNESD